MDGDEDVDDYQQGVECVHVAVDDAEEEDEIADDDSGSSEAQEQADEEEADRREYGIYQCLPVEPGEPDWQEGEPQSVEEYLRRVRWAARSAGAATGAAACDRGPAQPDPGAGEY
jgi:hypothetical protein